MAGIRNYLKGTVLNIQHGSTAHEIRAILTHISANVCHSNWPL